VSHVCLTCVSCVSHVHWTQFAALYAALVAALHGLVGPSVGARFLELIVRELDELLKKDEPGARGINLSLIFANLYIFKVVACPTLYAFVRLLTERFSDGSLDMLLALLRTSGAALRADDPAGRHSQISQESVL